MKMEDYVVSVFLSEEGLSSFTFTKLSLIRLEIPKKKKEYGVVSIIQLVRFYLPCLEI